MEQRTNKTRKKSDHQGVSMSLQPDTIPPIPEETARVARQLYRQTNRYCLLRAEWYEHYGERMENFRFPKEKSKREILAEQIGRDGSVLLQAVYAAEAMPWLGEIPAVEVLRRVWVQQF
jgi:hypothetical protein